MIRNDSNVSSNDGDSFVGRSGQIWRNDIADIWILPENESPAQFQSTQWNGHVVKGASCVKS
ncbi:hypothetical protein AOT18_14735 [Acinetobacter baumannii]|nr:hypothetical protein AOT18_14735 [Acinetobacter baumannii]